MGRADPLVPRPRPDREPTPSEPRLRILMAEVQARCGGAVRRRRRHAARGADDAAERPAPARSSADLRGQRDRDGPVPRRSWPSRRRARSPEDWADRRRMTWCAEPGVSAARVVWLDARSGAAEPTAPTPTSRRRIDRRVPASRRVLRRRAPLRSEGRTRAVIELWCPWRSSRRPSPARGPGDPRRLGGLGRAARRPRRGWSAGSRRSSPRSAAAGRGRGGAAPSGEARGAGRVRRRGRPRAEQSAGRDRRPRQLLLGQGRRPRGRPLAPDHPRPGPAGPPHPPRPDVRRPPARAAAARLPAPRGARDAARASSSPSADARGPARRRAR